MSRGDYQYLKKVDFSTAKVTGISRKGSSAKGPWEIYEVKSKDGKPFEFTVKVGSEGIYSKKLVTKANKNSTSYSFPVFVEEREFLETGVNLLGKKLKKAKASKGGELPIPSLVEASSGEVLWLNVPSRGERIRCHMSLDGKMSSRGIKRFSRTRSKEKW